MLPLTTQKRNKAMADIIQQSKMLRNAIKHEYKALESRGAKPGEYDYDGFELWLDSTLLYGDGSEQTRHAIEAVAEETWEYQVQSRSQKIPTWLAITDDTLQKWYSRDKYNDLVRTGRIVRGGAGFEIRVLRRRVSPPEVIE